MVNNIQLFRDTYSFYSENVTFWLGPKTPTGNFVEDFMPSENGFYVRPKPIEMSAFATRELPVSIVIHILFLIDI